MKLSTLKDSIAEAKRFIKAADACVKTATTSGSDYLFGSKETGAAKRESMDLTRKLAELRGAK